MVRRKSTPHPQSPQTRSQDRNRSKHSQPSVIETSSRRKHRARTREVKIASKSFRVHTTTLRSIKLLQASTFCLIPKLPFCRIVREIIQDVSGVPDMRIQIEALEALQESAELYLTTLFEDTNLAATHAKRITVQPIDMKLIVRLRRNETQ